MSEARFPITRIVGDRGEVFRFVLSGGTGSAIFFGLDQIVYYWHASPLRGSPAASWIVSYLTSSFITHALHFNVTFRGPAPYWRSLRRTYLIYGVSVTITAVLITLLEQRLGLVHELAWLLSLCVSGTLNYLAFRNWGFRPRADTG